MGDIRNVMEADQEVDYRFQKVEALTVEHSCRWALCLLLGKTWA